MRTVCSKSILKYYKLEKNDARAEPYAGSGRCEAVIQTKNWLN